MVALTDCRGSEYICYFGVISFRQKIENISVGADEVTGVRQADATVGKLSQTQQTPPSPFFSTPDIALAHVSILKLST